MKGGAVYLKGKLSPVAAILVFPNDHKRNDHDPDYFIYLDENRKEDGDEKKAAANDL